MKMLSPLQELLFGIILRVSTNFKGNGARYEKRILGQERKTRMTLTNNLAMTYKTQSRLNEAKNIFLQVIVISSSSLS
jgi:hypothetical protein